MQRRLTLALIGIALAAVVLVGAGVLLFSSFGARQEARTAVTTQLDALAELTDVGLPSQRADELAERFGRAFGIEQVGIVRIDSDGAVSLRNPRAVALEVDVVTTAEERALLAAGEPVLIDQRGGVVGLLGIASPGNRAQNAVLIRQPIAPIPESARRWFLVSAALVLGIAVIAGSLLSRRIVRPITEIETATVAIADGDLAVRIDQPGDDEIGQLAHAINRMAADLGRSRALEQQFLLSVSHDLRTPLSAIRGYAEALTDGAIDDPVAAGTIIERHADRLDRLVRDLLDLSRLDARQFRIESQPTNAGVVVEHTVAGLVPSALGHGLTLEATHPAGAWVHVDSDRLGQIVANLIDNAIKYAEAHIVAAVFATEGQVHVTVSDDGPGIAADDLPHVFERLYVTQQAPRRAEQSSGLGLAIVRELVHAMGGTVEARSPGTGTTIAVAFPQLAPPSTDPTTSPETEPSGPTSVIG